MNVDGNERNLIGCCGIYCGACFAYRGDLSRKAAELRELLKREKFNKIATAFEWIGSYRDFSRWLSWLVRLKCGGCQTGGGNPFCAIRKCCRSRGYTSCADCPEMPCKKLDWITRRYKKWNLRNLEKIREVGYETWLNEMRKSVDEGFVTGDVIAAIRRGGKRSK